MRRTRSRHLLSTVLAASIFGTIGCSDNDDDDNPSLNDVPSASESDGEDASIPIDGDTGDGAMPSDNAAALVEAQALLDGLAADGGTPYDIDNGARSGTR